MNKKILIAVLAGQVLGLFGFVEPLYVPFVLIGPLVVGAVAAARRVPLVPVMALWASVGLNMLWVDWVLDDEDQIYHVILSVILAVLAAIGWGIVAGVARLRRPSTA